MRARGVVSVPVTLWFSSTDDPAAILDKEPRADRGFGRKLLAQMQPTWPISVIGQFPLNRSTPPARGEFYIAAYPGLGVIQTLLDAAERPSRMPAQLPEALPALDVFAIAFDEESGFGAFAHWEAGQLRRSFAAHRDALYEDIGVPEAFEGPAWAGEATGINLPFVPAKLAQTAQREWLGVEVSPEGPDINVVAYAVDGRPEPKLDEPSTAGWMSTPELAAEASSKLGLSPGRGFYDDYENADATPHSGADLAAAIDSLSSTMRRTRARAQLHVRQARRSLAERLRHTDR